MNEYQALLAALTQLPFQVAMVLVFYWLFNKSQERLYSVWDKVMGQQLETFTAVKITLVEQAGSLRALTDQIRGYEDRQIHILERIEDSVRDRKEKMQ